MTVEQFKKTYSDIQKEATELSKEAKPILKKLKTLFKKCDKLGIKIDKDKELYEPHDRYSHLTKKWNIFIIFRLQDAINGVEDIDEINNILYNIKHTKFKQLNYNTQGKHS